MSDIHGNLPALETIIKREKVDGYINLGDVVNYAPWSNECVELIDSLENCKSIKGNHEEYFIERKCEVKHPLVSKFFDMCFPNFKYHNSIIEYKDSIELNGYELVHTIGSQYVFKDTELSLRKNTILGHSHQQYERNVNNYRLINPGSVGQNRKYINLANYVIWTTEKNTFDLKYYTFDIDIVLKEMKTRKYPQECIDYYQRKDRFNA